MTISLSAFLDRLHHSLAFLLVDDQSFNTIKMPDDKNSVPTDIEMEEPPLSRISYLNLMLHHGYINSAISEYGKLHGSENLLGLNGRRQGNLGCIQHCWMTS